MVSRARPQRRQSDHGPGGARCVGSWLEPVRPSGGVAYTTLAANLGAEVGRFHQGGGWEPRPRGPQGEPAVAGGSGAGPGRRAGAVPHRAVAPALPGSPRRALGRTGKAWLARAAEGEPGSAPNSGLLRSLRVRSGLFRPLVTLDECLGPGSSRKFVLMPIT